MNSSRSKRSNVVDLDDVSTWPDSFLRYVRKLDGEVDAEVSFLSQAIESQAIRSLDGSLIHAYHCTRLTDRESVSVREIGLQPLSFSNAESRIENARIDGEITEDEAFWMKSALVAKEENREGHTYLNTNRSGLSDATSVRWLLSAWGGEGINMGVGTKESRFRRYETIGTPTVVIARLDLGIHGSRISPGVALAALRQLRTGSGGTTVVSDSGVGAEFIESLEHPGGVFWKRYVWTPKNGFL
jgi:hypothetical protein